MTVLLIAIFAHTLGDFIFQTDEIAENKKQMEFKAFAIHISTIFIVLFILLSLIYQLKIVLIYSLIIAMLHGVVDFCNCWIEKVSKFKVWKLFLIDQLVHIITIFFAWNFFEFNLNNYIDTLSSMLIKPQTAFAFNQFATKINSVHAGNSILNSLLIYGIAYLFFSIGGGYFISKILKGIGNGIQNQNNNEGLKRAGNLIGILERILIITLVINNSLAAIAFVITAKSIARYDKITSTKEFSEYFLIGTFLSVLIGMIGGYALIGMLNIFA